MPARRAVEQVAVAVRQRPKGLAAVGAGVWRGRWGRGSELELLGAGTSRVSPACHFAARSRVQIHREKKERRKASA